MSKMYHHPLHTDEELARIDEMLDALEDSPDDALEEVRSLSVGEPVGPDMRAVDPDGPFHRYWRMRLDGQSHSMAIILATGKFPGVRTDSEFLKGHCNGNQFESCPKIGDAYRAIAEAHGVSTNGSIYMRGLARFPGDPEAWVSGRGDVARLAGERGWGVQGSVEVQRRDVEPAEDAVIGEDIVSDYAEDLVSMGMRPGDALEHARKVRSGGLDDYDPADHVREIPPEAMEFCPDFGGRDE